MSSNFSAKLMLGSCFTQSKTINPALKCQLWAIFCALGSLGTAHQHWAHQSLIFPHILDKKTPLKKTCPTLLCWKCIKGEQNSCHSFSYLHAAVGRSLIRHLWVLLSKAHRLPLGASKMLKGHCTPICALPWNCEGALRRRNLMSVNTALKPSLSPLFSMHPSHFPLVHPSIFVSLSAFFSFLVCKDFAQMAKNYVLLPVLELKSI